MSAGGYAHYSLFSYNFLIFLIILDIVKNGLKASWGITIKQIQQIHKRLNLTHLIYFSTIAQSVSMNLTKQARKNISTCVRRCDRQN